MFVNFTVTRPPTRLILLGERSDPLQRINSLPFASAPVLLYSSFPIARSACDEGPSRPQQFRPEERSCAHAPVAVSP